MCFQLCSRVVFLEAALTLRALKKGSHWVHLAMDSAHVGSFTSLGSEAHAADHAPPTTWQGGLRRDKSRCGGCKSPAAESLQNAGVELNEMLFSGSLFAGM